MELTTVNAVNELIEQEKRRIACEIGHIDQDVERMTAQRGVLQQKLDSLTVVEVDTKATAVALESAIAEEELKCEPLK